MKRFGLLIFTLAGILSSSSCTTHNQIKSNDEMPARILWAWERPEDLRFLDARQFGVAFLAQTLILDADEIVYKPRRQPLEINSDVYLIAVTRIETNKAGGKRPSFSAAQQAKIVNLIVNTLARPHVKAVQIDFDAVASERKFYGKLMNELKTGLPPNVPLTMTSLASWCVGDAWFNDFPVDEAVPMAFEMGADTEKIRSFLSNGNDWREPLCRGSYGFSIDEPQNFDLQQNRRVYYFKRSAWNKNDLEKLRY